jgi:signal peptidase I
MLGVDMRLSLASLALVGVLLLSACSRKVVPSGSMSPTIKRGSNVSIDWTAYLLASPKRWDVVCFEPPAYPTQLWVMRVVGLPGDTLAFATGGISLNGKPIVLPSYLSNVTYVSLDHPAYWRGGSTVSSPFVVPTNSYFVLGDNSTNALDSRFWGALPRTNILGKVRGV